MGTDETAHVLNDSDDGNLQLTGEGHTFTGIEDGDILGRRHDDCPADPRDQLAGAEGLVACSGRRVDDQIIEIAPVDLFEKLPDDIGLYGSAPDDWVIGAGRCKGNACRLQVGQDMDRLDAIAGPAEAFSLGPEHLGDVRAVQVDVKYTCLPACLGQRIGQVNGNGFFPTPPLPLITMILCRIRDIRSLSCLPPSFWGSVIWIGFMILFFSRSFPHRLEFFSSCDFPSGSVSASSLMTPTGMVHGKLLKLIFIQQGQVLFHRLRRSPEHLDSQRI